LTKLIIKVPTSSLAFSSVFKVNPLFYMLLILRLF
jgi:hypothetical protein